MTEESLFQKRIRELAALAYQRDIVTFTDFLNLNELHMVNSQNLRELGVRIETFGGYEFAERQIAAFLPDALSYEWEYPICCLHIQAKSKRFAESLSHRDYLGAVLSLGIERQVLGDILVEDTGAYLFCLEHMASYIGDELREIRHTPVSVCAVEALSEVPKPNLQPVQGSVASCRLDAVIALAFRTSRSSIVSAIQSGQVFINGRMTTSNACLLKPGEIVSVRGQGRFRFEGMTGTTKKGRCQVRLYRYV